MVYSWKSIFINTTMHSLDFILLNSIQFSSLFRAFVLTEFKRMELRLCVFSKNLLIYYCKCCNVIGYATRYLFVNRYLEAASNAIESVSIVLHKALFLLHPQKPGRVWYSGGNFGGKWTQLNWLYAWFSNDLIKMRDVSVYIPTNEGCICIHPSSVLRWVYGHTLE